jgi:hypothetical protein
MDYYFLFAADENGEATSPISWNTPSGKIIVVFQDENETMAVIAAYIASQIRGVHGINSVCWEFSSIEDVAWKFRQAFLNMESVSFLLDSDPVVAQLVAGLRQSGY